MRRSFTSSARRSPTPTWCSSTPDTSSPRPSGLPSSYAIAFSLRLRTVHPRPDAERDLWQTDPDACCRTRKVEPLERVARRQGGVGHRRAAHRHRFAADDADRPRGSVAWGDEDQPHRQLDLRRHRLAPSCGSTSPSIPSPTADTCPSAAGRAPDRPTTTTPVRDAGRARRRPNVVFICPSPPCSWRSADERRGDQAEEPPSPRRAAQRAGRRRRLVQRGRTGAAQVPRHLPAGRPRRPPRADVAEVAARLFMHGSRLGAWWPPDAGSSGSPSIRLPSGPTARCG